MGALVDDCLFNSGQTIEDHCSSATLHIVHGGLNGSSTDSQGNDELVKVVQSLRHLEILPFEWFVWECTGIVIDGKRSRGSARS